MKKLFFGLTVGLLLTSCNVYRTINFNADHSGNMETKIDMTQMMAMMNGNGEGFGGMGNMSDMAEMDKAKSELEGVVGISNVKMSFDTTGIMMSSYDFTNPEALLNAMNSTSSANSMVFGMDNSSKSNTKPRMTFKGKKFYFEEIDKASLKKLQSNESKKEMAEMDMMLASSNMSTTITFPVNVKKVSYKNASITNDKTVGYTMPVKDFFSKDYKPLTILLK